MTCVSCSARTIQLATQYFAQAFTIASALKENIRKAVMRLAPPGESCWRFDGAAEAAVAAEADLRRNRLCCPRVPRGNPRPTRRGPMTRRVHTRLSLHGMANVRSSSGKARVEIAQAADGGGGRWGGRHHGGNGGGGLLSVRWYRRGCKVAASLPSMRHASMTLHVATPQASKTSLLWCVLSPLACLALLFAPETSHAPPLVRHRSMGGQLVRIRAIRSVIFQYKTSEPSASFIFEQLYEHSSIRLFVLQTPG